MAMNVGREVGEVVADKMYPQNMGGQGQMKDVFSQLEQLLGEDIRNMTADELNAILEGLDEAQLTFIMENPQIKEIVLAKLAEGNNAY